MFLGSLLATLMYGLIVVVLAGLVLGTSLLLKYILSALTCTYCKPMDNSIMTEDKFSVLFPIPGAVLSPTVMRPIDLQELQEDELGQYQLSAIKHRSAAVGDEVDGEYPEAAKNLNRLQWMRHLGTPLPGGNTFLSNGFPYGYAILSVPPGIMIATVSNSFVASNNILMAQWLASCSPRDWLPVGPSAAIGYNWDILQSLFEGITLGLYDIFVSVPLLVVQNPLG